MLNGAKRHNICVAECGAKRLCLNKVPNVSV